MVGNKALLYTWTGTDPQAKPDRADGAPGHGAHRPRHREAPGRSTRSRGEIKDGFVWGRGTLDNKSNLFAQMEAIELLIGAGFKPNQTVYLVMGDDEEVSGLRGALPIAELLKSRNVRLDWVLDEGLLVLDGVLPGLSKPAALIGLAEKGYGTFFLSLDTAPGHSSMPPQHSAIGSMSAALARLEANPMPGAHQGHCRPDVRHARARNERREPRDAVQPVAHRARGAAAISRRAPSSNAMLRTTTALTIIRAGNKDNVLPGRAEAAVNFRMLPGDSLASVEAHLRKQLANDDIKIKQYPGNAEPSPVSPTDSTGYRAIQQAVRQSFPDAVVAPGLMIAATDSRHFSLVSDAVYRFSPFRLKGEDLARFHGNNERLAIVELRRDDRLLSPAPEQHQRCPAQ